MVFDQRLYFRWSPWFPVKSLTFEELRCGLWTMFKPLQSSALVSNTCQCTCIILWARVCRPVSHLSFGTVLVCHLSMTLSYSSNPGMLGTFQSIALNHEPWNDQSLNVTVCCKRLLTVIPHLCLNPNQGLSLGTKYLYWELGPRHFTCQSKCPIIHPMKLQSVSE